MLFVSDDRDEAMVELKRLEPTQLEKYEELIGLVATQEVAAMNVQMNAEEELTLDEIQDDARRALVMIREFKGELVS